MKNENEDAKLIQRILNNDEGAFATLMQKYQKQVHALAWRKVDDFHIAEEITQDTFLKVYEKLSTLKNPNQFAGWFYVIANRLCIAWLRKKHVPMESLDAMPAAEREQRFYNLYLEEQREDAFTEQRRELVKQLLQMLPDSERTVVTLYYLSDLTCEEISKFLGVSPNTIKSRLHRARERLKKEEPMVRKTLGSFQIAPHLTASILRKISRVKLSVPTWNKPLVPLALAASAAILVTLMVGMGAQSLLRFQQPYSLNTTSEKTVEIVDAPIVISLNLEPDVRTQLGNSKVSEGNKGSNRETNVALVAAAAEEAEVSVDFTQDYTQWYLPERAKVRLGKGAINDVRFSPDGTRLAVATSIGIWIYDAHTGAEIMRLNEESKNIRTIAFSPDGNTLASSSRWRRHRAGSIQLWDMTDGRLLKTFAEDINAPLMLAFSKYGKTLASVHLSRGVVFNTWDVRTGSKLSTFIGEQDSINRLAVAVSPDLRFLASLSKETVWLWNMPKSEQPIALKGHTKFPMSLTFSPDSKKLASGDATAILVWDVESRNQLSKFAGEGRVVDSMAFSPDGKILASGSSGGVIRLWDAATRSQESPLFRLFPALFRRFPIRIPTEQTLPISALAFSSDGKALASSNRDGSISVWNLSLSEGTMFSENSVNQRLIIKGHTGAVKALGYLENGKTLMSGSFDGTIRLWQTDTGTQELIPTKYRWFAFAMAFSEDCQKVAIGTVGGEVQLWDADTRTFIATFTGHRTFVDAVAFSPDSKMLASGSRDKTVRLWDIRNRKPLATYEGHTDEVTTVVFSPDSKTLASTAKDEAVIHLWDITSGRKITLSTEHLAGTVGALAFSPDGKTLSCGHRDGLIQVWDVRTHELLSNFVGNAGRVTALAFSPDSTRLANGSSDGLIRVWDVDTKRQILDALTGHASTVTQLLFSQNSQTLVSGSRDNTILVWELDKIGNVDK